MERATLTSIVRPEVNNMYMTAHQYKELYWNMNVPEVNEDEELVRWHKVKINKYLIARQDNPEGKPEHYNIQQSLGDLEGKLREYFAKSGSSIKVFVGTAEMDERTFTSFKEVWHYARKAFWGKGTPEEVQITLQLAIRFGLIKKDRLPLSLQEYCEEEIDSLHNTRIGLDCNGFVGNYLEHGFRGKPWDSNKPGSENYEANTGIKDIMDKLGPEVKKMSDIRLLETYVMGLVDASNGQVINRFAGNHVAHIVVTTPFTFVGMLNGKPYIKMPVVESTGGKGLTESDYFLLKEDHGVFTVWRGSKEEQMHVKIRPVR